MQRKLFLFLTVFVLLAIPATVVQGAGPTGAIFTTTPDGGIVNENTHYDYKIEVYLDGGPGHHAPQHAAGLDDGWYVFQVTDPSGGVLLSMDPAKCRVVEVSEGVITRLVHPTEFGEDNGYKDQKGSLIPACHIPDEPEGAAGVSGRHDTNIDYEGGTTPRGIVVQLMPFLDTPNPGGVYKAWVTYFDTYKARGGVLNDVPGDKPNEVVKKKNVILGYTPDPGFGPPRSDQKTDNFKVKEVPPYIKVLKYEDVNGNGMYDEGVDLEIPGWKMWIWEDLNGDQMFDETDDLVTECYTPCWKAVAPGVLVKVVEELPMYWVHSFLYVDGVSKPITGQPTDAYVQFYPGDTKHEVKFGNFEKATKSGYKWHDLNANGAWDTGEPPLSGWKIKISGTSGMGALYEDTTWTGADGKYQFKVPPGTYTVSEECPAYWYQSWPAVADDACGHGVYNVTFHSGDVDENNNFGNYQLAKKAGYKWHDLNANGMWETGEPVLEGWKIVLTGTDGKGRAVARETWTDAFGKYWFWVPPGTYTVSEVCPADWYQTYPAPTGACGTGAYNITLVSQQQDLDNDFGNYQLAKKAGYKWHDLNANGTWEAGEPALEGWKIMISGTDGMGNLVSKYTYTDAYGKYWFLVPPGTYTVSEQCPAGWYQSYPYPTGGLCGTGVYNITLISQQQDLDNHFGNYKPVSIWPFKFFDANGDGIKDPTEDWLDGFEFCLYDAGGNLVGPDDYVPGAMWDPACQTTDPVFYVGWGNLLPGTYTIKETLPPYWFPTKTRVYIPPGEFQFEEVGSDAVEVTVTLKSGDNAHLYFGDVTNCVGLTPGYWSNWRNHYTAEQFEMLLPGTIASTIAEADMILTDNGCDGGYEVNCMRRFLLANQLTLNLTMYPDLPNPDHASLYPGCKVIKEGGEVLDGDLGYWLGKALEIHYADGMGFEREYILWVKTMLDWFANLNLVYYWP